MLTIQKSPEPTEGVPPWHPRFLVLLPTIRRHAAFSFRRLRPQLRDEMVQEVVANGLLAYWRLVEQDREHLAYPSALARFAVGQARQGRQVGTRLNVRDVSSRYCQLKKGIQLQRLDQFDVSDDEWKEVLIEDRRATPAEVAASRIDFAAWLGNMPALRRKIAQCLATGECTFDAAKRFALSPGRISQLRREFQASWQAFHGEHMAAGAAAAA